MKKLILYIFLLVALPNTGWAKEAYFKYSVRARDAYRQVIQLRIKEAEQSIASLKLHEPDNLIVYHIEDYIDFFKIFITEDEALFKELEKNKRIRLRKIRSGSKASPHYLYAQAEIELHWALLRIKFGDYLDAFNEVSDAYQLLKKNQRKFPEFIANKKSLGILHSIVGSVPDKYRWGVKLLGRLDGSIPQGRREIEEVLDYAQDHPDFLFREETEIMYAFLLLHLINEKDKAWEVISRSRMDPASNPLACFVRANIALHAGKAAEAERILSNRPQGSEFFELPYLDFMDGLAKLYRLDATSEKYFLRFIKHQKGRTYIKEAYQKLAWNALIHGDLAGYQTYIQLCLTKGSKDQEGDEAAYKEALSGKIPDVRLLKARVLFDGGYYQRAYRLLSAYQEKDFASRDRLEFLYRLARISHLLGWYTEAVSRYMEVLNHPSANASYLPCNAALQIGLIYEHLGNIPKAREYFKKALSIQPPMYRTTLHARAKAGLNRTK